MISLDGSEEYLKAKEIAALLKMDRTAVYKLPLPWIKVGRKRVWLVAKGAFEKFLADRTTKIN